MWTDSERAGVSVTKLARHGEQARNARLQQGASQSSPQVRDAMLRAEAQQPSRGQTKDLSRRTELLKNNFYQSLHRKTTNSGGCPSKFVSRRISLLLCCTAPNRIARRKTYSQGSAVHTKALLYQSVHVLHHNNLLHCRQCLWSALSAQRLVLFCRLQLLSPAPHCCLRRCVFAVLQAPMVVPGRFYKLNGRCGLLTGPVPLIPLALVSQLPWDR